MTSSCRVLAIWNPESGRLRRDPEVLRPVLDSLGPTSVRAVATPAAIHAAVADLDPGTKDTLVVIGGDGTAQAVLTALARRTHPDGWPRLLPVAAGSTNMTATGLGSPRSLKGAVEWVVRWLRDGASGHRISERAVLRLERETGPPLCGLFFGAGLVSEGVRHFRDNLREVRVKSERTSWLAIARVLFNLRTEGAERAGAQRLTFALDGGDATCGLVTLCLASTLDRLLVGTRPYWGTENAPIHFTTVSHDARRLWSSLPRLGAGRPGGKLVPEHGYRSRNAHEVRLRLEGPFVIDGELFEARHDQDMVLTAPHVVRWLIPA